MTESNAESLAQIMGRNARRLRGHHKLDDVAKAVNGYGWRWASPKVVALESGRVSPRLETLIVLCYAFADLLGHPVAIAELFKGDEQVCLTDAVALGLDDVRAGLSGEPLARGELLAAAELPAFIEAMPKRRRGLLFAIHRDCGDPEARAARALGVEHSELVELMADVWGHTLTTERDKRAGPDANAQTRGQITRDLRNELREAMTNGNH
jgi:hypothetical protein